MSRRRPRPRADSNAPFTAADICTMSGFSYTSLYNLVRGVRVLKRKERGGGNWRTFSLDDAVRINLARELIRIGFRVAPLNELFRSVEQPGPGNRGWAWIRTREAHDTGAALVLIMPRGTGPRTLAGHACIASAYEAKSWLSSTRTAIVVDINTIIRDLQALTGLRYQEGGELEPSLVPPDPTLPLADTPAVAPRPARLA